MDRERVAQNQRARLYGAMMESISQRGYQATTVAHVIGLAGVSRRAFYELFSNKEECFLATYDINVARARKLLLDAWAGERGWANRLHASCKALLDDFARTPKGGHLVLVDSLGVGPQARERLQRVACTFERLIAAAFGAAPDGIELSPLASKAIVGGVRHIVFMRMLENREQELYTLTDEVLDWVESYRRPVAARLRTLGLARPTQVHPVPATFLLSEDKCARILGSVIHLTLDEGYARLTDPQIAKFAGMSTEAFHRQFAGKEECFLKALDESVEEALDVVSRAVAPASTWAESVHLGVAAFLEYLIAHPALSRIAFIDVFEVGPGMIERMAVWIGAFTKLIEETGPQPQRGPVVAGEAVTGAIWGIVSAYVVEGRMRDLVRLVDQVTFLVLAPYIGPKAAVESIEDTRKRIDAASTAS